MLDRGLLRNEPDRVAEAARVKGEPCPMARWQALDTEWRRRLGEVEELRRRKNDLSKEVSRMRREGGDPATCMEESRKAGVALDAAESGLSVMEAEMGALELQFPNIPDPDVPVGRDETANIVLRTHGDPREFHFEPRPHWELLGSHLDSDASGMIAGANFILLRGWAAKLQRCLINWMMDVHWEDGMEEIWPPFIATRESMTVTGQIPKMEEDMYHVEKDDLFLVPTAEIPLTNLFRGALLREEDLPVRVYGYTPCFRREAGSYGRDTRGLNRVHQFEKVEMVRLSHPEEMIAHVGGMLELLGLTYRVTLLCTGDLSFSAAKCCDMEVWAPGQKKWLEVSSISNFRDFQARRGQIRFRPAGGGKPQLVHTLNGSGLALPRIIAALLENGQTADGSVELPRVIAKRIGTGIMKHVAGNDSD
jgi:seryl-tRNA synthetase